ncbi:MAG: S8 family serine peptidase, partial [Bacilli bacterium]
MFKKGFLFLSVAATSLLVTSLGFINNDEVLARDTKIIVELDNDDEQTNKKFLNQLATLTEFNYRINDTFSSVFNGYTLSVNNVYVDYIKDFSTVKDVTIDKEYHFDMSETSNVSVNLKNTDIPTTNASAEEMNVPSSSNKGEGTFIAILDSGFLLTHNAFTNLSSSVDKKVSKDEVATIVTTSGFHGNNEGSGDASKTYYNDKIPYYFDYGGSGSPSTDYDVYSPCSVHGTHVASLAAANGDYKGIAPNAQLALMKVFTESVSSKGVYSTGAYDSVILEALEDCVKLDVDVLNMSLGSDLDECSSRSKSFEVIDTLESKGVVCSISAGNSGKSYFNGYNEYEFNTTGDVETGTLGSYAVSESAAIIASGVLSDEVVSQVTVNGSTFAYRDQVTDHTVSNTDGSTEDITFKTQHEFLDLFETDASQEYVVVPNLGNTADYDGIDVSGKIAVIMRGEISFTLKVQNAIAKGAKGVAIINNSATDAVGYFDFSSYEPTVPVVSIENRFKDLLLNAETKVIEKVDGSHISDFSTDGTTAKLNIGPTITTPGSNIFGAVPGYENSTTGYIDVVSDDSYDYLSGTSMAAPNYAGAVALILSDSTDADKEAYKKTLDMRTMSTANVLTASNGVNESPRRQGAGLIDVSGAINSKVYLTGENEDNTNKAKIELKNNDEIKEGKVALKFKATNEDTTAKKYKATVNVLCPELADYNGTTYASVNEHTLGSFSQDVTIEAGESEISLNSYSLTSEAKEYLKAFENGSYIEGYVTLTPENSSDEELSIPYLGFYGDYESADCVEPFSFEKEENVVYGSDLLNSTVTSAFNSTYAKPNANFGSYWVGTGLA